LLAADSLVGQRIDHFQIHELLAKCGGMARCTWAHDMSLERTVAIKGAAPGGWPTTRDWSAGLVMEASGPGLPRTVFTPRNVVQPSSYIRPIYSKARPYFAMEHVPGGTLAEYIQREGPLPWGEALEYIIQGHAGSGRGPRTRHGPPGHQAVQPVAGRDSSSVSQCTRLKVADFGVAAPTDRRRRRFSWAPPYYAAPEQIAGDGPSMRGDVYALAITFHELLTGRCRFRPTAFGPCCNSIARLRAPKSRARPHPGGCAISSAR